MISKDINKTRLTVDINSKIVWTNLGEFRITPYGMGILEGKYICQSKLIRFLLHLKCKNK